MKFMGAVGLLSEREKRPAVVAGKEVAAGCLPALLAMVLVLLAFGCC
jgi:hypothetical protein